MKYLLLLLLPFAVQAEPIRTMPDGTKYIFSMIIKCGEEAFAAPRITEMAEMDATAKLAEGDLDAGEYMEAMLKADPEWGTPQGMQILMRFSMMCEEGRKSNDRKLGKVSA